MNIPPATGDFAQSNGTPGGISVKPTCKAMGIEAVVNACSNAYREMPQIMSPRRTTDIRNFLESIGLEKHENYLLDPSVRKLIVGLGWDKGADLDSSAVLLDSQFRVVDVIWYRQLRSNCGSVVHSGDNLTGKGNGDDETIAIDLDKLPYNVHHIFFVVCVYSFNIFFTDIRNAYVRILHGHPKYNQHLMCFYNLTEMSGNAMTMAQLTRRGGYWNFKAIGEAATGRTILQYLKNPQNLSCLTTTPSIAPILRKIVISVERGYNLAASDRLQFLGKPTSDPYYIIRFKKRTFTSTHIKKTLNPVWKKKPFDLGINSESETKTLKISVFDYNLMSKDSFLGHVRIPVKDLYTVGVGHHSIAFDLEDSKKKEYIDSQVSGSIQLEVIITEVSNDSALSQFHV